MKSMNLFGVSIESQLDETKKIENDSSQLLQDLVTLTHKLDPDGISMNFKQRKAFNYYDPYNEEANEEIQTMLRWANKDDLFRASLVINQFKYQWEQINEKVRK